MKLKSDDVVAILDDLGIDKAHYIGYSPGGTTGYGVAKHAPERFNSIIIGGMHPYGSAGTNASVDGRIEGLKKEWSPSLLRWKRPVADSCRQNAGLQCWTTTRRL